MPYPYLAVIDGQGPTGSAAERLASKLHGTGLLPRHSLGAVTLFAGEKTPTLLLPGDGILVGHLFSAEGEPVRNAEQLPQIMTPPQILSYILEHCWGEYILIQPGHGPGMDRKMIFTRDPSGGVPCVYSLDEGSFVTSDISLAISLGLYRKRIDWEFITHCLLFPHAMTHRTGLSQIQELLPGTSLTLHPPAADPRQVWSPWDFVAAERRQTNYAQAAACVRGSVIKATAAWARTDGAVVLELSGGLDSSILASCLALTNVETRCYNVVAPVPGADERYYAALVAEALGASLQTETLGFEAARFDAPFPPWTVAPRISMLQHALNETAIRASNPNAPASHFSGGGGDTIFCYLGNASPAADAFRERGISAGLTAIRELSDLHQCTFWKAARLTLNKLLRPLKMPHQPDRSFLNPGLATPADEHPWCNVPADALVGDQERIRYLAGTQLYRHSMFRGPANSLRLPLLSQPVVEACLRVPSWMWIAGGRNRAVARAAFSDRLPVEVLNRKSKGDFTQYLSAAYRRRNGHMRQFLLEGELASRGLLATDELDLFFRQEMSVQDRSSFRIIDLCMVENWVRHQH